MSTNTLTTIRKIARPEAGRDTVKIPKSLLGQTVEVVFVPIPDDKCDDVVAQQAQAPQVALRLRVLRAMYEIQMQSIIDGTDSTSMEDIDLEISAARQEQCS